MATFLSWLEDVGMLDQILLPPHVEALLTAFQITSAAPQPSLQTPSSGTAALGASETPLFFDLQLDPGGPNFDFLLAPPPGVADFTNGFDLSFDLAPLLEAGHVTAAMDAAGNALTAATVHSDGDEEWLEPAADPTVKIRGAVLCLLVEARRGETASMTLGQPAGQPQGVINLSTEPTSVLLGGSGFGLDMLDGFHIDMTGDFAPPAAPGEPGLLPSQTPAWKGLSVRDARFFLPGQVPMFGRTAGAVSFDIGFDPVGIALSTEVHTAEHPDKPKLTVRLECVDPAATGLASFVPTLVEVAAELPVNGYSTSVTDGPLTVNASKPLIARARFARASTLASETTRVTVGIESKGDDGLVSFHASDGAGSKVAVAAGAFATALIADKNLSNHGGSTAVIIAAGAGLGVFLTDRGKLVLHGAELSTEGTAATGGVALTDKQSFSIDYSVDVAIKPLDLAFLSISLDEEQPLRVRLRGVTLSIDHSKTGLDMVDLDFEHATMEVEDPGQWLVDGPGSLFDVLGTRSGRGSMWVEIDLRFKISLGPIQVSGATVRGTFNPATKKIGAELRGLDITLTMPGLLEGEGKIELGASGFEALLQIDIVPLRVNARGFVRIQPPMVILALDVDLPGPIPLANSGLGLYGIGGAFGVAARISEPPPGKDPVTFALQWDETNDDAFTPTPGNFSLGFKAVVGTVADYGYAFSARAGIFLTVPDIVIRGSLDAKILSGPMSVSDPPPGDEQSPAIAFRGVVVVDPQDAVTFGLSGLLAFPVLLRATIPAGGRFPTTGDLSDWYFYVGADGYNAEGRGMGPATISVLPDILKEHGDGYFMLRGKGITLFPRGSPFGVSVQDNFVVAFGFGVDISFGARPFAWVEVSARADVLIASSPLVIAGFGRIDGSLHIGPVSIGVDADLKALITAHDWAIDATVCGHVNLLFKKIRKCVHLRFDSGLPSDKVPWPTTIPIDLLHGGAPVGDNALLIDDHYRTIGALSRTPEGIADAVWPDALVSLTFSTPPKLAAGLSGGQFKNVDVYPEGDRARQVGGEMLRYEWTLTNLRLFDVTGDEHGPGALVPGEFSCAWQAGRSGDLSTSDEPAELVLFDVKGTFYLDRTTDGGLSLPHDPIGTAGRLCQSHKSAKPGWTLGAMATRDGWLWTLPPEFITADSTQSRVSGVYIAGFVVDGDAYSEPVLLDETGQRRLPATVDYGPGRLVSYRSPVRVDGIKQDFLGELELDYLHAQKEQGRFPPRLRGTIVFDDPLFTPSMLAFSIPVQRGGVKAAMVQVVDQDKRGWTGETAAMSDGRTALVFKAPKGQSAVWLRITWPMELSLGLLGLLGTTMAAHDAAIAYNQAQQAAAAAQEAASQNGQLVEASGQSGDTRCVLDPGRTYRLDVGLEWTGFLTTEKSPGKKTTATDGPNNEYLAAAAHVPAARSFFFRTTPVPQLPIPPPANAKAHLQLIHTRQNVFEPAMLERHLTGYEPSQAEVARFRRDHITAHFDVGHVAALAGLYNYELKLGVRRIDAPGPAGDLQILTPSLLATTNPSFLGKIDQIRYAVATGVSVAGGVADSVQQGPCPTRVPGVSADTAVDLDPRAWYEAYVLAEATDDRADGRLSGVTFQTSRWYGPADMLAALRFGKTVAATPDGDLEIDAVTGFARGSVLDDDGAFDDALAHIGFVGWPLADKPRASVLWLPRADSSGWDCAGALIESPEPIHRPGRCELEAEPLSVVQSPLKPAVSFDLKFRDRSGSRLLFLASKPFRPAAWSASGVVIKGGTKLGGAIGKASSAAAGKTSAKTARSVRLGGPIVKIPGGAGVPSTKPVMRQPALKLTLRDKATGQNLTGLLALTSSPSFAGEAR